MEARAKNISYITVIGTPGAGKSLFLAALAQNEVIAESGKEKVIIKGLKADSVLNALVKNPKLQLPTKGRRGIRGNLNLKGTENAWSIPLLDFYCFDDRGGAFSQMLDYYFEAENSTYSKILTKEFASNCQAIIIVISIKQLIDTCAYFNPCTCTVQKSRNCKHKNTTLDCLHNNAYVVKRLITAVHDLTFDKNIPVAIAITHTAGNEDKVSEASELLNRFIEDTYENNNFRPNYYFLDSIKALYEKRGRYAKKAALPLCDVFYQLCDRIDLKPHGWTYNLMWGDSERAKYDLKRVLLGEIERGGI